MRELENCIQRALVVFGGGEIRPQHLGLGAVSEADAQPVSLPYEQAKMAALRGFQREYVEQALTEAKGNISQAARACGMTRAALQRILRTLDIDRSAYA